MSDAPSSPRRPRVLFVSYVFPPAGGVGVQRVLKWSKYLPENGWDVSVLTASNPSVPLTDESLLSEVPEETVVVGARTLEPGYGVKAAAATETTSGLMSRVKAAVRRPALAVAKTALSPDPQILWKPAAVKAGRRLLNRTPHDVIVATGPPFSSFLIGRTLARLSGVPLVLDYRDEWSISNANWEQRRPGPLNSARQRAMERRCLRAASLVLGTTPRGAEEFARLARDAGSRADVSYVWNGFDPDDFPPVEGDAKPDLGNGTDRLRLTFTGTLWTLNSVAGFADGLKRLTAESPDLVARLELVFVGRRMPAQEAMLDELAALPCAVRRLGFVPHAEATRLMRTSDALLLPTADVDGLERVVCAKTFEYLAAGRPIVCVTRPGDQMDAVRVSPSAVCADVRRPAEVAAAIRELVQRFTDGSLERGTADLTKFDRRTTAADLARELGRFWLSADTADIASTAAAAPTSNS